MTDSRAVLDALVAPYEDRLRGFCVWLTHDPDLSADLAQEAWCRAYRAAARGTVFDGDASSWLRITAHNAYTDRLRGAEQQRTVPWDLTLYDPPDPADVAGTVERAETARAVHAVLGALRPLHRDLLLLHYFADWPLVRIGARYGLSVGAVKSHLTRARAAFRQQWERP